MKTSTLLWKMRSIADEINDCLLEADAWGVCDEGCEIIDDARNTLRKLENLIVEVETGWTKERVEN
jgi:hypothetical protein